MKKKVKNAKVNEVTPIKEKNETPEVLPKVEVLDTQEETKPTPEVLETKEEPVKVEETPEIDPKAALKKEKKLRFLDELKAFIVLVAIIGTICGVGYYLYKNRDNFINDNKVVDKDKEDDSTEKPNEDKKTEIDFKELTAKDRFELINDEYISDGIVEYSNKVYDINGNLVYEANKDVPGTVISGINGSLYLINSEDSGNETLINLYKIKDKKLEKVVEIVDEGIDYVPLVVTSSNFQKHLKGFVGTYYNRDENDNNIGYSYFVSLDGKKHKTEKINFTNKYDFAGSDVAKYIEDKDYLVVSDGNKVAEKYGLYSFKEDKLIINYQYDGLYPDCNGNYVAIKNGKAGIIDRKLKKLVDFQYDFIDRHDDFFVVSKDGKMAIMDKDYKLVTKFSFEYPKLKIGTQDWKYSYVLCCADYNPFNAIHVGNKYVLYNVHGYSSLDSIDGEYKIEEAYVISNDGSYKTFKTKSFNITPDGKFAYYYDKKVITVLDDNFKEKFKINLSNYDYSNEPRVTLINGNTIKVSLDSNIYFDYATGKEVNEVLDYDKNFGNINVKYNGKDKEYIFSSNDKVLTTVKSDGLENKDVLVEIKDGYYFFEKDKYIYFEKGE